MYILNTHTHTHTHTFFLGERRLYSNITCYFFAQLERLTYIQSTSKKYRTIFPLQKVRRVEEKNKSDSLLKKIFGWKVGVTRESSFSLSLARSVSIILVDFCCSLVVLERITF